MGRREACAGTTNPETVFSGQEGEQRQCVLGMAGVGHSRDVDDVDMTGHGDQLWKGRERVGVGGWFPNS